MHACVCTCSERVNVCAMRVCISVCVCVRACVECNRDVSALIARDEELAI